MEKAFSQRVLEIRGEMNSRFGFIPPFFEPAMSSPQVLENLWQQTLFAYLDNPWPNIFKEKLAALLARYCSVPYCLICHSSALRPLGLSSKEILTMLQTPMPISKELFAQIEKLDIEPLAEGEWPQRGSQLEHYVLQCCVAIFLNQDSQIFLKKLKLLVGADRYENLISFLSYNRTCVLWAEAHPQLAAEEDQRLRHEIGGNYLERFQDKCGLITARQPSSQVQVV